MVLVHTEAASFLFRSLVTNGMECNVRLSSLLCFSNDLQLILLVNIIEMTYIIN